MSTLSNFSQDYRATPQDWQAAPKATVNLGTVNANGNAGALVALTAPTDDQLGRVVAANGAVQRAGAPLYTLIVRALDPDAPILVVITSFAGDANTPRLYETPSTDGLLEVYDVRPGDTVSVRAVGVAAADCDCGYRIPRLDAY